MPSVENGRNSHLRGAGLFHHMKWEHLLAGVSGGVIATLILHPLDLVKIRFQVHEGAVATVSRPKYKGILDAFLQIARKDGVTGIYRGVVPNVWGAGISWGFYFLFYNSIKTWMQDGDTQMNLGPVKHMLAASEAGLLTLILTNPIWVVKTRMCLQYETPATSSKMYKGMFDALYRIFNAEGFRGLYRGFLPGVFGISHGAVQFMAYEEMKSRYNIHKDRPVDYRLKSLDYIVFAALSKIIAASTTYPYQVIRARLQDQHRHYAGNIDIIRQIFRHEGWRGFYKGLFPSLLRVTPACCITFVVYENFISHFTEQSNNES
ncbi:mitochondrial folate transporter/carrier-like isoform X2 [Mizuhopecten yessoensis]|uniref:Solute carrier family 25 member 32 n=1 Tax=Mizuhopecten yessoensis TaxID=6573 RepID=A0A210PER6_MIZYE|nr:mitochondrial folate transporter/carrier-like isoform X2 [Mizuhopecten yessoensis]OWF34946.1 Mitochondrial folate transporter/carrier [Mizuhopecten yessoensis]